MPATHLVDLSQIDFSTPLYTQQDIEEVNPQRFELSQLTAVVHVEESSHLAVGYKDVTHDEFWVRGHMPDFPLMPGVIQCECAAQLGGFYAQKYGLIGGEYMGFGGIKDVRFRRQIEPGCRLDLVAKCSRLRAGKLAIFDFQGFVGSDLMFEGTMMGASIDSSSS